MRTELFDFDLPEERIALHPASPRDAARLLIVDAEGGLADATVRDLADLLRPGDALVLNDTRVIPAALSGTRSRDGHTAAIDVTLIERLDESRWQAFARPQKRLKAGDVIRFGGEGKVCFADVLDGVVEAKGEGGLVTLQFNLHGAFLDAAIAARGEMPLPPYIAGKRAPSEADRRDYQTMFAARDGAVAAPTAGLHFTPKLMQRLAARGIQHHFVTLHVGAGTFLPVKAEDTREHVMHVEWGEVAPATAAALERVRAAGGRIVAVGTTSLRLLETAAADTGEIRAFAGPTQIFITPGYRFKAVDVLMTNFHLPRSTLFMLVAAFSGLETMRTAYRHAIDRGYRFYSYGDACLLHRSAHGLRDEDA